MRRAQAIRARIAAADDDHRLAGRQDRFRFVLGIALVAMVLLRQEFHREMDALQLAPGDRKIARLLRAHRQDHGLILALEIVQRSNVRVGDELDAFGRHLLHAPVDPLLLHFEVGDAVAQQAADTVAFFEHRDPMARARQLLRGRQARRTGTDHRHALAGADRRRLGLHPAFLERVIDNRALDHFDGDRRLIDAQHARGLARSGTDAAGELRKIVGRMQHAHRRAPPVAIDQIIPVRNDVVQRAPGVAERHAAVHAAGPLRADLVERKLLVDLEPVIDAFFDRPAAREVPARTP